MATALVLLSPNERGVASAAGPTTVSYATVGAATFTVPAGVTSLSVVAVGGGGAGSVQYVGGSGASVTATLTVVPGQVLDLFVGGGVPTSNWNVGGGGSTNIGSGGVPLVIAGGGGGGGRFGAGGSAGGPGGVGANGVGGAPGLGGSGGIGGAGGSGSPAGLAGGNGNGGKGGDSANAGGAGSGPGAGGTGGWYGGGGGGGYGGGGGGGTQSGGGAGGSLGPVGATFAAAGNGGAASGGSGNGSIQITYTEAAPVACQPGTYSSTGNEPCTPAPAGSYVATSGAIAPTLCPVGMSSLAGAVSCSPIQSLSILGGQGTAGSQDANTDWSADVVVWDAGISSTGAWHFTNNPSPLWRPAYMVSGHPWGQVPGTNTWMNCGPTTASSECGASGGNVVAFRVRFNIPATLTNLSAAFWINSDNAGTYYLNGTQITDRLVGGGSKGAVQLTPSGCVSGCSAYGAAGLRTAALASALHAGNNEMIVIVEDWGGASGFNFRADIKGLGSDPIVIVPPPPSDTTPPVITPTVTGTLGANGWYTSDVNVSWTVTDAQSAVSSQTGCGPTTVTTDTTGMTFTCTATSAGGTASESVTVKRDATAPTASAAGTPAANVNGWNSTDVTVSFAGTDATSGIASCSPSVVISGEGAGQSASGTCTDNAGNVSAAATASISIDTTAPTATAAAAPAPNGAGWNNTDVTVTFTGSDALSGIASCTPAVMLGEGAGQSASGTCADNAGNVSAPASVSGINVDKTAPVVTITGVSNSATYIIGGVPTAGCSTTDALSGVATAATLSSTGGPAGTFTVTCAGASDTAGNAAPAVTASYTVTYALCAARGDDDRDDRGGDRAKGHESGSTIPVKIRMCDANGRNVGSRSLIVRAISLSPSGSLADAGKANPGNLFRFDDGTYIFNLQTKGLPAGTYTLDFQVGNDPTVYHYSFTIRPDESKGKASDSREKSDDRGKSDEKGKRS